MPTAGTYHSDRAIADTDWGDQPEGSTHDSISRLAWLLWQGRGYKAQHEKLAYLNERFLFGDHWYAWSRSHQRFVPRNDLPGYRVRLVYNEILSTVEQRIAKMVRSGQGWSPRLAASGEAAKVARSLAANVLTYEYDEQIDMPAKVREYLQWLMSSAVAYLVGLWDRDRGPTMTVSLSDLIQQAMRDPNPQEAAQQAARQFADQFGQEAMQAGQFESPVGAPNIVVAPIFEMITWPFTLRIRREDVALWMWTRKMTVEQASIFYRIDPEEVRMGSRPRIHGGADAAAFSRAGADATRWADEYFWEGDFDGQAFQDDSILVHTIFKTPNRRFPKGRVAIVFGAGGMVAVPPRDIDEDRRLAYVPIWGCSEKPIRGNLYGTCIADQIRGPNEDMNRSMSDIADYRNRRVRPTLVDFAVNRGLGRQKALTNAPAQTYTAARPDTVPRHIESPDMGSDFFATTEFNRRWIADTGGLTSIDKGSGADASIRAASAIAQLREANDMRLKPFAEAVEEVLAGAGSFVLAADQVKAIVTRISTINGPDNEQEIFEWYGSDLQGIAMDQGPARRLVTVKAISNLPKSASEVRLLLDALLDRGVLDPVKDRTKILELAQFGEAQEIFDEGRADRARQNEENKSWERGQIVGPPDDCDDHGVHIEGVEKWKKTERYRRLKFAALSGDPNAQQVVLDVGEHLASHKRLLAQRLIEPQYYAKDADLSLFLRFKSRWLKQIADGEMHPSIAPLVEMVYPAPLSAVPLAPPDEGGSEGDGGKNGDGSGERRASTTSKQNAGQRAA